MLKDRIAGRIALEVDPRLADDAGALGILSQRYVIRHAVRHGHEEDHLAASRNPLVP